MIFMKKTVKRAFFPKKLDKKYALRLLFLIGLRIFLSAMAFFYLKGPECAACKKINPITFGIGTSVLQNLDITVESKKVRDF